MFHIHLQAPEVLAKGWLCPLYTRGRANGWPVSVTGLWIPGTSLCLVLDSFIWSVFTGPQKSHD